MLSPASAAKTQDCTYVPHNFLQVSARWEHHNPPLMEQEEGHVSAVLVQPSIKASEKSILASMESEMMSLLEVIMATASVPPVRQAGQ